MIESLNRLITALRAELEQYGEMLALLDQQQELVMARAAEGLMRSLAAIQNQVGAIQRARLHRETCRRELAEAIGQEAAMAFAELIPLLPIAYRPLVQALVQENNELLVRLQQRARQNHLLLSRSLELMRNFIGSLFPAHETQTYDEHGSRLNRSVILAPVFDAVG